MTEESTDDTWKLSPKGVDVVRSGVPRGAQSDNFIVSRPDELSKEQFYTRRTYETAMGHYVAGRHQD
ncbi:hypothetical protein PHABIO_241 [Pseudomonas phage Phabio]|uniref:Uncharacterized protein n=1 Tax=Pseudomonas phage Phabio TaxID=2006668 RepID=A0A1Y0STR8_9CAUD|nr:hypothetical protein [Escherichia coli]YP_010348210.1 hypothetical protein MZD05_gp241 [Pseudomonas phage Phabio]ARV76872.1 hypothetical protein PHABIO_241 [Pseudomonas phage Phabio]